MIRGGSLPTPRKRRPLVETVIEPVLPAKVAALESAVERCGVEFPAAGMFVRAGRVSG